MRPLRLFPWVALALLVTACGERTGPPRLGCSADHYVPGTYRFDPGYLEERLGLLEDALRLEDRAYDRNVLTTCTDALRTAWAEAVLVLAGDGTFRLEGVVHPEFAATWQGTWSVRLTPRLCELVLRGGGEELRALLGDGWVIPWFEEPAPGMVLDLRLVRDPDR